jgi:hypothetical protein
MPSSRQGARSVSRNTDIHYPSADGYDSRGPMFVSLSPYWAPAIGESDDRDFVSIDGITAMTDAEVTAALDAHDALVSACIEGALRFDEFVLAYGTFPAEIGREVGELERYRQRIAFHSQVSGIASGLSAENGGATGFPGAMAGFVEKTVLMRLRQLMARYPEFKVTAGTACH